LRCDRNYVKRQQRGDADGWLEPSSDAGAPAPSRLSRHAINSLASQSY
jgi:hypothetical protein